MSLKLIILCAEVLLIQNVFGQCINNIGGSYGFGNYEGLAGNSYEQLSPWGCSNAQWSGPQLSIADLGIAGSSCGGSLNVQTSSPIAPGSISVQSENQIQGPLSVSGTLPFLSAVAFEGLLPSQGSGAVSYQIGNGRVAILEENISGYDSLAAGAFDGDYNSLGSGWNQAWSGINGINNCAGSAANIYGRGSSYGLNAVNGINCGCGY